MNIQEEIHKALNDIQKKLEHDSNLNAKDMEVLLLTSLIEEEGE
tara:strand:+ start:12668 stop:12799 length:132 start_codon:yes stop_codon:yes gene_type:complete